MAVEPTSRALALATPAPTTPPAALGEHTYGTGPAIARQIGRQMRVALPAINAVSAALSYIFIVFVVPLPGPEPPASARVTVLLATVGVTAVACVVGALWGERAFKPIQRWLEEGRAPDEDERLRTLRIPLHEAGQVLAVWSFGGVAFGTLSLILGGSVSGGVLVMVIIGGLVASALCYLATEWIARPAAALALSADPPTYPLTPGIGLRVYLAWEFGTAVAVGGTVVVSIAYLFGAKMSPQHLAATVIFLGGLALTVGLATLLVAVRSVAEPVRAMRSAMRHVEAGDTDVMVPVDDGSEVGLLQAGFNRMVAGLRERDRVRDLFGRHVGEEVAQSALGRDLELGGELREASILFVDVVGSTAFAAVRDPREVVETLNRFFEIVVEVVTLHGGWVNKFEGDAALCVFGAPTDHPDGASAALVAGRELRRRLALELDGIEAAIGLSAGRVVAGNIGTAKRYEYTVIGDAVNEAARLTDLAKGSPSRLLACEAILSRASDREAARWEFGEPVVLRGRSAATRVAAPA
ncbi:MAG TPA: adenylate/guanylate cyclase domain-containing protein [Solirubrobacteraceae bacterium]|nr:adenylate/guanylate cyclase domain-containing protein [Solirubrobacteraceae bacterium]